MKHALTHINKTCAPARGRPFSPSGFTSSVSAQTKANAFVFPEKQNINGVRTFTNRESNGSQAATGNEIHETKGQV